MTYSLAGRAMTIVAIAVLTLGSIGTVPAEAQEGTNQGSADEAPQGPDALTADAEQPLADADVQAILDLACKRRHPAEYYRGVHGFEVLGPLWLWEPDEERARGVILPPAMRVYLLGRGRRCGQVELADAREVAGPEIWVVVWRYEDPPGPPGRMHTTFDQKVLTPTEIRFHGGGRWHEPIWTRSRDSRVAGWYWEDWNEKESLVAAFSHLDRSGGLFAEYRVEEDGRSYLTESEVFSLSYSDKWWSAAFDPASAPRPIQRSTP